MQVVIDSERKMGPSDWNLGHEDEDELSSPKELRSPHLPISIETEYDTKEDFIEYEDMDDEKDEAAMLYYTPASKSKNPMDLMANTDSGIYMNASTQKLEGKSRYVAEKNKIGRRGRYNNLDAKAIIDPKGRALRQRNTQKEEEHHNVFSMQKSAMKRSRSLSVGRKKETEKYNRLSISPELLGKVRQGKEKGPAKRVKLTVSPTEKEGEGEQVVVIQEKKRKSHGVPVPIMVELKLPYRARRESNARKKSAELKEDKLPTKMMAMKKKSRKEGAQQQVEKKEEEEEEEKKPPRESTRIMVELVFPAREKNDMEKAMSNGMPNLEDVMLSKKNLKRSSGAQREEKEETENLSSARATEETKAERPVRTLVVKNILMKEQMQREEEEKRKQKWMEKKKKAMEKEKEVASPVVTIVTPESNKKKKIRFIESKESVNLNMAGKGKETEKERKGGEEKAEGEVVVVSQPGESKGKNEIPTVVVSPPPASPAQPKPTTEAVRYSSHYNRDYCDTCKDLGTFICCEGCPRSFHFTCMDPPVDEDNVPAGSWYCRECRFKKNIKKSNVQWHGVMDDLIREVDKHNPVLYRLPKAIRECFEGVGLDSNTGNFVDLREQRSSKRKAVTDTRLLTENGQPLLCHCCCRSSLWGLMLQCDYCPLSWHLDCLNPPLTSPPANNRRWMCPNHIDHHLKRHRLAKNAQVQRISHVRSLSQNSHYHILMDDPSSVVFQIPENSIKVAFVEKIHSATPPSSFLPLPSHLEESYNQGYEPLQSSSSEIEQWLTSLVAFQTEVSKFLRPDPCVSSSSSSSSSSSDTDDYPSSDCIHFLMDNPSM